MPRKRTIRTTTTAAPRRPTNRVASVAPYTRDPRWATPSRPRNDLLVVDITDRVAATSASSEDPLALTA